MTTLTLKRALLPHLFFTRRLPTEQSPQLPTHEAGLLNILSNFLDDCLPELPIDPFACVRETFDRWAHVQSGDALDPVLLHRTISALSAGQYLPLFVRAQNAGLLLSVVWKIVLPPPSKSTKDEVQFTGIQHERQEQLCAVLSTFPASLPNEEVMSATGELTCVYPATSVRVECSPLLRSIDLAQQIAELHDMRTSTSSAKSHKAGVVCDEV